MIPDVYKMEAVRLGLLKMFKGGYFDICVVRNSLEALNIHAPRETMSTLHTIHCVNWGDMTPEMRAATVEVVLDLFKTERFTIPSLEVSLLPSTPKGDSHAEPSFWKRLIG